MTSATINPWEPARSAAAALTQLWPDPVSLAAEDRCHASRILPFDEALRALEALIRAILLGLAAAAAVTLRATRPRKGERPAPPSVDRTNPATWRCAFALAPQRASVSRWRDVAWVNPDVAQHRWLTAKIGSPEWLAMRSAAMKARTASAFVLARRWQACLNVLADVDRAVRRAAVTLARKAARQQKALAYFLQFEPEGGWNTNPVEIPEPPESWRGKPDNSS